MKKFVLSLISVMVAVASFAQVTTSGISGLVTDGTGQPLIGATVIAVHTPSGTDYGVATNIDGRYTVQGMRSGGPYKVTISFVGYQTVEYSDVYLTLGESYPLNADLVEGESIEEIVVSVSAFDSHKTGAATNFSSEAIAAAPTVSRSIYDIVEMSPLANSTGSGISFAGTNNRYNSFQIDGAISNDVFGLTSSGTNGGSTGSNAVSLDALEEIQIVVAPFDVRQGGFTGGGINAITKSGTNTVKGSAYMYYNDENFYGTTAGELEEGEVREKVDEQTTRIMGLTIGGPIIKDKLFAFVSVEQTKEINPVYYYPGYSDYSDYLDPATAAAILDHYTTMTGVDAESFSTRTTKGNASLDIMTRIDWNINKDHKFMFRYQFKDAYSDSYSTSATSYYFDNSGYSYNNITNSFVAELNSRFSNNISNEFRAGYTRVRDHREIEYLGPRVQISNVDWGLDDYGDPETGTVYIGTENNSGVNAVDQDVFTITDNVSIYKGQHTITLGTHNEIYSVANAYIQYSTGYYQYSSLEDYYADNAYQYYYGYATECDNQDYMPVMNAAQFSVYAQDEWNPNSNLSLTAGLRLDLPVFFNSPPSNDEFNDNDVLTNDGEYVIGTMPSSQILWSPRVGFRYKLEDNGSRLLRGGVGLFTGRIPFVWLHNAFTNNGIDKESITTTTSTPSLSNTSGEGVLGSQTVNTISSDFKMPQVFRANLAYEHIFGNGWKVTLEGLFTKNINNISYTNVALEESGDYFYAVSADAATEASTYTRWQTKSDEYAAIINLGNTSSGYSYNLTAMVEKRFANGLNFMASYTFGHSYAGNDGTSSVAYSNWYYNYAKNSNDPDELGYSSYDRPHVVNAYLNYTTPLYGGGRWSSVAGLSYKGTSGSRYSYSIYDQGFDVDGDGKYYSYTLMYFPTDSEIDLMRFDSEESRETFREWMNNDEYANSHRGEAAVSNGGSLPFYSKFDLHFAQNYIYNKKNNSRIEVSLDIMNVSNLINRNWGMRYYSSYGFNPLEVTELVAVDGGYEAVYTWEGTQEIYESEYSARWYMQIGARITF